MLHGPPAIPEIPTLPYPTPTIQILPSQPELACGPSTLHTPHRDSCPPPDQLQSSLTIGLIYKIKPQLVGPPSPFYGSIRPFRSRISHLIFFSPLAANQSPGRCGSRYGIVPPLFFLHGHRSHTALRGVPHLNVVLGPLCTPETLTSRIAARVSRKGCTQCPRGGGGSSPAVFNMECFRGC